MTDILPHGQFFGRTTRSSSIRGLVLTETIYPPRFCIPRHSHEDAYFCFILRGSYTESYGFKTRDCDPFTLAFHPRSEVHSENFADVEVRSFNVGIESSAIGRIREYSDILDRPAHLHGGTPATLALRLYQEFRCMDGVSPLAIEGLVLELMAAAARRKTVGRRSKSDVWLNRVKDLVHARFNDSLSIDEIAREAAVHPMHLEREFRRMFGCTIGEYVRQLRVEYSCRALADSDTPLKRIALDAGFFDQSHFCRVFRALTGVTPREYRRQRSGK
jgi:AraC family transcriptional regulator